ncbi:four helix bundle protein [Patescibacteria group bacterium]
MAKDYLSLDKLEVYKLARKLSKISWKIYQDLDWQDKKIMGNQFIESTDSVGANVAEGYGRFHYLDKVKFYFNSRGSLLESRHWFDLLSEREKAKAIFEKKYLQTYQKMRPSLNGLINSTMKAKEKQKS